MAHERPVPTAVVAEVGDRIRTAREDAGLTRGELARAVRVCTSYVSFIESGQKCPSVGLMLALCRVLGLDMGELTSGLDLLPVDAFDRVNGFGVR